MKKLIFILPICLMIVSGCATSESTVNPRPESNKPEGAISIKHNASLSLADYLRRVPGISVRESGNSATVMIHGPSSFMLTSEPLYVVDGTPVGNDYDSVNNLINVNDIDYVRVLKGNDAAIYGVQGGNGVILIKTKRD